MLYPHSGLNTISFWTDVDFAVQYSTMRPNNYEFLKKHYHVITKIYIRLLGIKMASFNEIYAIFLKRNAYMQYLKQNNFYLYYQY